MKKNKEIFKYETHCHTSPVSACAKASPEDTVRFYKEIGYDGVFITNHFIDGNMNPDAKKLPFREQIDYFCQDYERAVEEGNKVGIHVFFGVELAYKGTDFLVYGLDADWYKRHPEIAEMKKTEELELMMSENCLIVQAHPYREAYYIDHIRLFPRHVHGVEVWNACQPDAANKMAELYAEHYGLLRFAGSDNHWGGAAAEHMIRKSMKPQLAGMMSEERVTNEKDFVLKFFDGKLVPFVQKLTDETE